jgi:hypothetical protein
MACGIPANPPQTATLTTLPSDAHAYAEAFLEDALAQGYPLGYFVRETHDGIRLVKQYTHHTICNGDPGCCPAVTLFADTSPPDSLPMTGETAVPVNWPVVVATSLAGGAVVALFIIALRHAGKKRR